MGSDVIEANVVMARCRKSCRTFGIRVERRKDNVWYCTWAFPLSEKSGAKEGYDNVSISGRVELTLEYPGCPYCGDGDGCVSCGVCKKLTCSSSRENYFTCAWCGFSGKVVADGTEFDLTGGGY